MSVARNASKLSGARLSEVTPRQLYQFEVLAELGSATKACRYLGISAPALTQNIARLETELGATLLDRSTRPARLTASGQHLLEYVRVLSRETDALTENLALEQGEMSGTLRIGCGPRWMVDIIPRALDIFVRDYPRMRIGISVGQMADLMRMLEDKRISVLFGTTDSVRLFSHHKAVEMGTDRFSIVARRAHPLHQRKNLSLADLLDERWIMGDPRASSTAVLRRLLHDAGLQMIRPTIELTDTLAVANTLRMTDCIGIFSTSTVRNLADIDPLPVSFDLPASNSGAIFLDRSLNETEIKFTMVVRRVFGDQVPRNTSP